MMRLKKKSCSKGFVFYDSSPFSFSLFLFPSFSETCSLTCSIPSPKYTSQAAEILQDKKKTKLEIGDMDEVAEFPKGSKRAVLVGLSYKMVNTWKACILLESR